MIYIGKITLCTAWTAIHRPTSCVSSLSRQKLPRPLPVPHPDRPRTAGGRHRVQFDGGVGVGVVATVGIGREGSDYEAVMSCGETGGERWEATTGDGVIHGGKRCDVRHMSPGCRGTFCNSCGCPTYPW